jgi:hypothetical protein
MFRTDTRGNVLCTRYESDFHKRRGVFFLTCGVTQDGLYSMELVITFLQNAKFHHRFHRRPPLDPEPVQSTSHLLNLFL